MAKAKRIRILTSVSAKNHDYMKLPGAEHTADYNDPDWMTKVNEWSNGGLDTALTIQSGTGSDSIKVVKKGGFLITVSGDSHTVIPERSIEVRQMGHQLFTNQEI